MPKTKIIKLKADDQAGTITSMRENGGILDLEGICFYFPKHFGFCHGVGRAIDMAFEACDRFLDKNIYLTDELIHNPWINRRLTEKGIKYLTRDHRHLLNCDDLTPNDVVIISAFGTHFEDVQNLERKGVTIVDCTCGAIISVWKRVARYAKEGFITVIHGKRNHEETRATLSQAAKEGGSWLAIENQKEAVELSQVIRQRQLLIDFAQIHQEAVSEDLLRTEICWKIGMANQTTMLKEESLEIQSILRQALRDRFGSEGLSRRFQSFDTICGATQDRQKALAALLKEPLDCLLIVGGFNSSNTAHLAEIASAGCVPFFHIESADNIVSADEISARQPKGGKVITQTGWLKENTKNIGITSGASTPDATLLEVIKKIVALRRLVFDRNDKKINNAFERGGN